MTAEEDAVSVTSYSDWSAMDEDESCEDSEDEELHDPAQETDEEARMPMLVESSAYELWNSSIDFQALTNKRRENILQQCDHPIPSCGAYFL